MAHDFNSSIPEAEVSGSLWVQDQPELYSEFQDTQSCKIRPCLNKQTNKQANKQNKEKFFKKWSTDVTALPTHTQLPGGWDVVSWSAV